MDYEDDEILRGIQRDSEVEIINNKREHDEEL